MSFSPFLVSLSISCFAFYVRRVTTEEMVRIFATIAFGVSFIVALVLAPWFIQALLLVALLYSRREPLLP